MMESDDFGPLTSADNDNNTTLNDEASLLKLISDLKEREQQLLRDKELIEQDFGLKRAKFKEIFLNKEDELQNTKDALAASEAERMRLEEKIVNITREMNDVNTAAALSETSKHDEFDVLQQKYQMEIASLQSIMKEAVTQAVQDTARKYELEKEQLLKMQEQQEHELRELHGKISQEREGFLATVAKSIKKVSGGTHHMTEAESLEEDMKKAKEDAEILKSVVLPLEEEISTLKAKLKDAKDRIHQLEAKLNIGGSGEQVKPTQEETEEKVKMPKMKELSKTLEVEKASRTDLELYVAVLNTQKNVLQADADKLRDELHSVCRMLELEKREHNELKRTWQMANDQFLESQRLMMMDMVRMEGVLSAEQQRQIAELKKKDADREAQEKRVRELEEQRLQQEAKREEEDEKRENSKSPSPTLDLGSLSTLDPNRKASSKTSLVSEDLKFDSETASLNETPASILEGVDSNSIIHETRSLGEVDARSTPERQLTVGLTEAQQKAITAPQPESEMSQHLLASVRSHTDSVSLVGKRLVTEKEWQMLQQELRNSREKLGKPCDMCNNYEDQLQTAQDNEKKSAGQVRTLERQLQSERQALANQTKYCEELESNLKAVAEKAQIQISSLVTKVEESEKFTHEMRQQFIQSQANLQDQLKTLTEDRQKVQTELTRLQEENDDLIGKHSKHASEMQEESIDLPNNMEEMQLTLLRYREDIIKAKVAREHIENNLRSEILFLKDRVLAEQQEKNTMEETLSQELAQVQEQIAVLQSIKPELDRETKLRQEAETKLKEVENTLSNVSAKSKNLVHSLQSQLDEHSNARTLLEDELATCKAKVQSLQIDLDNSEAVQRDFVKLSQSLQIQLEKIRAAEHEVRWQHEEDIEECNNCRLPFSVTRRKHHCKHCGKIFCHECLTKSVNSGPHLRPSKVCDVCHTILVQDATPYFSSEPPITPD